MPRRSKVELSKITWRIRTDDLTLLRAHYSDVNTVVRDLLHAYCSHMREKARATDLIG